MTFAISSTVRLNVDCQERQPEIGHSQGIVIDVGVGTVKVRWPDRESWHKLGDLEEQPL
jgi:hypothetical protein